MTLLALTIVLCVVVALGALGYMWLRIMGEFDEK